MGDNLTFVNLGTVTTEQDMLSAGEIAAIAVGATGGVFAASLVLASLHRRYTSGGQGSSIVKVET